MSKTFWETIFDKDRVNTGRQTELDLLKAFSIIMMIITHCIDDLYAGYADHLPFVIIDDVLAQSIGAAGFMICMGAGIAYNKNTSPDSYVRRGISLLMTGQLLNIFRYAIPGAIAFLLSGEEPARDFCMLTLSSDILQFAGLFFLCMGLFAKLGLKGWHIFVISLIANIAATPLVLKIHTGYYAIDQLIGFVVFTESESYFPLLHWMIYPAFGIVLGEILQHVKDKRRFYGIFLVPTAVIWGLYYYFGIFTEQNTLKFYNDYQSMAYVNQADGLLQLICNFSMICMFYFLTPLLNDKALTVVGFISKNINRYYCVHSVLIYYMMFLLGLVFYDHPVNTAGCYILCAVTVTITSVIVWLYDKKLYKPMHAFFSRNTGFWYALIIVITVLACLFASMGPNNYPHLLNEYNDWI